MKITSIEQQKNNPERYSVFIDNKFAFGLDSVDIFNFKLKINDEISAEKYNIIMEQCVFLKAKNKAIKYLGYKARTEKEIYKKLLTEYYPSDIIEKTITFLKKYNYVNDENYARAYITEKFNIKGYGIKRLTYELKSRGIESSIIENIIYELNDEIDEKHKAVELLNKKIKGEKNIDYKLKQKLYGYLARRGYNYSVIKYAFNKVLQEDIYVE